MSNIIKCKGLIFKTNLCAWLNINLTHQQHEVRGESSVLIIYLDLQSENATAYGHTFPQTLLTINTALLHARFSCNL